MLFERNRLSSLLTAGVLGLMSGARQVAFTLSALDVELLDAVEKALMARIPVAIVLPAPGAPLPLALAVEAVLAAIRDRGRLDARVGVASPRLAERQLYDQLAYQGQRLADLVPRVRITADGTMALVGSPASDSGGRLYLTSHAEHLAGLASTLETMVIDEESTDLALLERLLALRPRVPVLYTTADLLDSALDTVRSAGGVVWGYDAPSMAALAGLRGTPGSGWPARSREVPLVLAPSQLEPASVAPVTVHVPPEGPQDDLDHALAQLWTAMAVLSREHQPAAVAGDRGVVQGLRWAWGTYSTLAALPVTPERYDQMAAGNPYITALKPAATIARQYANHSAGARRDAWSRVADSLARTVDAAQRQPRTGQILRWLDAGQHERCRRAIVTRSRISAAALRAVLRESSQTRLGWDDMVDVICVRQLARYAKSLGYREICVPGGVPRTQSWLLAAPPAAALTILAAGPREGWRINRAATAAREAASAVRRETVQVSAPRLSADVAAPFSAEDPAVVTVVGAAAIAPPADDGVAAGEAWTPFTADLLGILADEAGAGETTSAWPGDTAAPGEEGFAEAIAVYLDETRTGERAVLLARPNDLVAKRSGTAVQRIAAKALEMGDCVVLVDRGARRDLFQEIAERLAERPGYLSLVGLIDLWHERAAAAAGCGLTHREILARMTGTAITRPGTVGTWIRGTVDGPLDGADVARFAAAVNDEVLSSIAAQVAPALTTMHRVRRRLGYWLAMKVDAAPATTGDAVVDAELGVHVADLLESVTDHTVAYVDLHPGRVAPRSALGVVLPARFAEDLYGVTP